MRLDLIWQIARKELLLFFASPIAYLVLSAFLAITLFVFFWGSAFFARNIADVRPMFEWLPIVTGMGDEGGGMRGRGISPGSNGGILLWR